jgi:hypothetical protein
MSEAMTNSPVYEEWVAAGITTGALQLTPSVPIAERKSDQRAADAARREWKALVKKVNRAAKKGSAV